MLVLVLSISIAAQEAAVKEDATHAEDAATVTQKADVKEETTKVKDATSLFLWSIIIGAVAITVAAVFGASAQSKAIRVASENIGRNPAAADSIRGILIIGLALIESLVIYVLLVDLIIFFIKWGKYSF
jgi:F-type H+-transporting ATPase subunit c